MAYAWGATSNSSNGGSGTSLTLTSVSLSTGDRAVVYVTYGNGARVTETLSDGTNTWTWLWTLSDATSNQSVAMFECINATAGTYTLTLNLVSAEPFRGIALARVTGVDNAAASVTAKTNNNAPGTGANAVTSGNLTPSAANGGMVAFAFDVSGGVTFTQGTGFTSRSTLANWDSAFGTGSLVEDKTISSTSAQAGTFTASSGGGRMLTAAYAIQDSGGGGGGGLPFFMQSDLKAGYIASKSGGFN